MIRLIWLLLTYLLADWFFVNTHTPIGYIATYSPPYHIIVGVLVWLACLSIVKTFWKAVAAVLIVSVVEDFLFHCLDSLVLWRPLFPIDNSWAENYFGIIGHYFSVQIIGLSLGYYVMLAIAGIIMCFALNNKRTVKNV